MLRLSRIVAPALFIIFAFFAVALPSNAAYADPVTCTITGTPTTEYPKCQATDGAVLGLPATVVNVYWMARSFTNIVTEGLGFPIDAHGICRYIDNSVASARSNNDLPKASSKIRIVASPKDTTDPLPPTGIIIPFKTSGEWTSFIGSFNNPTQTTYAVPCARPKHDIDTGLRTYGGSDDYDANKNKPVLIDVDIYGSPIINGRPLAATATEKVVTKAYPHSRRDYGQSNLYNTAYWTETFVFKCTSVVDTANNDAYHDAGKWSCVQTSHDNPIPPLNPPVPQSCGTHPDGSIYFVNVTGSGETGSRPATVPEECPYGAGTRTLVWTNQFEVQCQNGTEVATTNPPTTKTINEHWIGECAPEPTPTCLFRYQGALEYTTRLKSECCVVPSNLMVCNVTPINLPATLEADKSLTISGGYTRQDTYSCSPVAQTGTTPPQPIYGFVGPNPSTGSCQPAMCGNNPSGSTYWKDVLVILHTDSATLQQCPAGGTVTYTVTDQAEYTCTNGSEYATGNTRQINSTPVINCNPQSCGQYPNGYTYWQTSGYSSTTRPATAAECAAGGTVVTMVENQTEYKCTNGTIISTGQTRQVNPRDVITCNPASCGTHASGTRYWLPTDPLTTTRDATIEECSAGGTATTTQTREAEYSCTNGNQTPVYPYNIRVTGTSTVLACNPASCGVHPNGYTYWSAVRFSTQIVAAPVEQCLYGGTDTQTVLLSEEFQCVNGTFVKTGREKTDVITHSYACNQPAACGDHPSGTTYWKSSGTTTSTRSATTTECAYGGTATLTWVVESEYLCTNGVEKRTSTANRNTLTGTSLSCSQPASCYGYPSGTKAWVETGTRNQTRPATAAECTYGGTVVDTIKVEDEYQCINGVVSKTGVPSHETVIRTTKACNEPAACGTNPSGSVYWTSNGLETTIIPATTNECPSGMGGSTTVNMLNETQYSCFNGQQTYLASRSTEISRSSNCYGGGGGGGGDGGGGDGGGGDGGGG